MKNDFYNIFRSLSLALVDDFKGFLADGTEKINVSEGELHARVAFQEMSKLPNWKYESGVGQNPIVEYMQEKRAIYVTKIPLASDNSQYQRTVGYLTDAYSELIEYKGTVQPIYMVLRRIALGMGYDVDEYTLEKNLESNAKTPVSITTYKADIAVKKFKTIIANRSLKNGDKPVFASDGNIMGFMSNGKFVNIDHYKRYSSYTGTIEEPYK